MASPTPSVRLSSTFRMRPGELGRALQIAWLCVSAVILLVLAGPFVVDPATIAANAPVCVWTTRYARPCVFCGMTTSFLMISSGDLRGALAVHAGSVPLYGAFVVNGIGAALWAIRAGFR